MKTIVDGIERFCKAPSYCAIECDSCGLVITPDPYAYIGGSLRVTARLDMGWTNIGDEDYCQECSNEI